MIDYKKLYGVSKVKGETTFISYIKKKDDLYQKLIYGFKNNLVKSFDQEIISELRKCYYGIFSGLIYIFSIDTTFSNIDNKAELLIWIFKDKNIKLVKGSTNSTRNILFYEYGQGHLDYNLWIEVEEGNKTWVYDLFSLLKMEKDFYYKLEEPMIEKIYLKDVLDLNKDFSIFSNQYDNLLYEMIDKLKESLEDSPYKELLIPEIIRYKDNISKEKVKCKKFW
ncbi:MAG: hypothetical protein PUG33_00165 [Mollicutes bacterium]|nr:hypothetical protein [Mollicutes bacterium]